MAVRHHYVSGTNTLVLDTNALFHGKSGKVQLETFRSAAGRVYKLYENERTENGNEARGCDDVETGTTRKKTEKKNTDI